MDENTYKRTMLEISKWLTETDLIFLKYAYKEIGEGVLERVNTSVEFIRILEMNNYLGPSNLFDFAQKLDHLGRKDLVALLTGKKQEPPELRLNNGFELNAKHFDKVASYVGTDWRRLGCHLDLTDSVIEMIDCDNRKIFEKAFQVLVKWRQIKGKVTWQQLKEILLFVQRTDIVLQVEKDFPDIIVGEKTQPELNDVEKKASREFSQNVQIYQPQVSPNPLWQLTPKTSAPSFANILQQKKQIEAESLERMKALTQFNQIDQLAHQQAHQQLAPDDQMLVPDGLEAPLTQQQSFQSQHIQVKPLTKIQSDGAQKVLQQHQQVNNIKKNNEQDLSNNEDEKQLIDFNDDLSQADINLLKIEDQFDIDNCKKEALDKCGRFGKVYLCIDEKTNEKRALKCISIGNIENDIQVKKEVEIFEKEISLFKTLNHERVVKFFGCYHSNLEISILMEYMDGGSLRSKISNKGALNEKSASQKSFQILEGLAYLHENNIVHRDIKGANILLDSHGNCKIADFGISKRVETISSLRGCSSSFTGTVYWMSPESINVDDGAHVGKRSDIWSFGCTVVEMLTTEPPWKRFNEKYALLKIHTKETIWILPKDASNTCKEFVNDCFSKDPVSRPSALKLLTYDWLKLKD